MPNASFWEDLGISASSPVKKKKKNLLHICQPCGCATSRMLTYYALRTYIWMSNLSIVTELWFLFQIDKENNVWITDVAMHQVFKFGPYGGPTKEPLIALGEKFVPGSDDLHYCKPTSVAVMSDARTFFVSDGYCNQRVIKYAHTVNTEGYHRCVTNFLTLKETVSTY